LLFLILLIFFRSKYSPHFFLKAFDLLERVRVTLDGVLKWILDLLTTYMS
jgi:hypothetical protein